MMRTRFAPSPTGYLHLGHAYSAQMCDRIAAQEGGVSLLRFEDIDHTRVREEFYAATVEDLAWLGITYSEPPVRQLDRMALYEQGLQDLIARGLVYRCFCTRRDLQQQAIDAPHGLPDGIYSGHCRRLTDTQVASKLEQGVPYAWRLNVTRAIAETGPLHFWDNELGAVAVNGQLLGDVVVARKDISTSYHIAVVMDDAAQGITHIVRGADLRPSTHVHRILQSLWGYEAPHYIHHRLLCDPDGKRLAKRHQSLAIRELRTKGATPADVWAMVDRP